MADQIPSDAVQAGVDAYESAFLFGGTADMVELILKAAAPLIEAAVYEQIAHEFTAEFDELPENASVRRNHVALDLFDKATQFRAHAKDLRAQS